MQRNFSRLFAFVVLFALLLTAFPRVIFADEGMFMPDKIAELPLAAKGLKIKPTDIYNPNGGGISEAVGRLSIGCTAEFVSPDGLILTNHHCVFDALVASSTVQNDYGKNGFRAGNRNEEMEAKDYQFTLTLRADEVTAQILEGITPSTAPEERAKIIAANKRKVEEAAKATAGEDVQVQVQALNDGMFYYKFHYYTLKDIRLVYAPPKSIGFFGGDPDNFQFPRHTGDFAFLRAYVGPDGKPASFSKNNVPYKPKKFLTISTAGLKDVDFTMIIGYPGGTTRYRESYSVDYNQNIRLPFLVDYLDARIKALQTVSQTDEAKRVALQGDIFNLANTYKAFDGGITAMRRGNIIGIKQKEEAAFENWINADPKRKAKYGEVLPNLKNAYVDLNKAGFRSLIIQFLPNAHPAIPILSGKFAGAPVERLKSVISESVESYEPLVAVDLLKFFFRRAASLEETNKISAIEKLFEGKTGAERIQAENALAEELANDKFLTTRIGLNGLISLSAEELKQLNNPFINAIAEISAESAKIQQQNQAFNAVIAKQRPLYMEGMAEMKGKRPYPDANFTQRFTYGVVKNLLPREAVTYFPFTTLKGVIEKDTGREPFDVPAKLRELYNAKDYGEFGVNGEMPVNFLTSNDIIGGNSGSPIMNANGEQVGIVFDSNYEGLGNDFFFSEELGRTISVDIRYVLFITEKFGNAGWILKEMNIVKPKAMPAKGGKK